MEFATELIALVAVLFQFVLLGFQKKEAEPPSKKNFRQSLF